MFSEAISIDKHFLEAYIGRGNAFLDYGDGAGIKAGQADYQRALLISPSYLPARYYRTKAILTNLTSIASYGFL